MVIPWKVLNSNLDSISVGGYYSETIQPIIYLPQEKERLVLSRGLLGKSKDALNMIDLDVGRNSAVNMFGHFLKYEVSDAAVVPNEREPLRSVFDVMMAAQRQLGLPRLPPRFQKDSLIKRKYSTMCFPCWKSMYGRGVKPLKGVVYDL